MKNFKITTFQLGSTLLIAPIPYLIFLIYFYKEFFYEASVLQALMSFASIFSVFIVIYILICCPIFYIICLKLIKHDSFNPLTILIVTTLITALYYLYAFLVTSSNTQSDLIYFPPLYIFSVLNVLGFLSALHFFHFSNLKLNDKN